MNSNWFIGVLEVYLNSMAMESVSSSTIRPSVTRQENRCNGLLHNIVMPDWKRISQDFYYVENCRLVTKSKELIVL